MSTLYTIIVTNNGPSTENFFFFQAPAQYVGNATVYSNSIYQCPLATYKSSGSTLTFELEQQYYAGAQTSVPQLQVGQASGYTTSVQAVDLTTSTGEPNNSTNLTVNPLGLSPAAYSQGVEPGAFRITTPQFNPNTYPTNAGLAVFNPSLGTYTLSNFIQAQGSDTIDSQPIVQFYVATGSCQSGSVINFDVASTGAALCDATDGTTTFNVTYNIDGSWSVSAAAVAPKTRKFPGLTQLIGKSSSTSLTEASQSQRVVTILNEHGSGTVATGLAPNLNSPVTVSNIDNPGSLQQNAEYQLQSNGKTVGMICTAVNPSTSTATFQ